MENYKAQIDRFVEENKDNIINDLRRLVKIPSIAIPDNGGSEPFGHEVSNCLISALDLAKSMDLDVMNHNNYYGIASYGNGPHRIGIFTHLDVVEVNDKWIYPPFELTEKDGYLIGRGSNDDKMAAIIGLYTLKAVKELGLSDKITLEVYLGCCEEKGMYDLDRYLEENEEPEFSMVPDFIFPVSFSEGGVLKASIKKNMCLEELTDLNAGKATQRMPMNASVVYRGKYSDQIIKLAENYDHIDTEATGDGLLIKATGRPSSGFFANDQVNAFKELIRFLKDSNVLETNDARYIRELDRLDTQSGEALSIEYYDERFGKLSSMISVVESTDDSIRISFDIRFPGALKGKDIADKMREKAAELGYTFNVSKIVEGSFVDPEDEKVLLINKCFNEVYATDRKPWAGGGTYAGKLKRAVAFGPKLHENCPFLPEGHGILHSPDEAIEISQLMNAVRIYIRTIYELNKYYKHN